MNKKETGTYYTTDGLVDFILMWAFKDAKKEVFLEPSCGDGAFYRGLIRLGLLNKCETVRGVEIDAAACNRARKLIEAHADEIDSDSYVKITIYNQDFHKMRLSGAWPHSHSVVAGNPPFIKQRLYKQKELAKDIFNRCGVKYSKLTNSIGAFLIGSHSWSTDGAKLGFVLPSDFSTVKYATPIKEYLVKNCSEIHQIDFEESPFNDIEQNVCILLMVKKEKSPSCKFFYSKVKDEFGLKSLKEVELPVSNWMFGAGNRGELIERINGIALPKIGDFCKVEVGLTSGCDDFFFYNKEFAQDNELEKCSTPILCKTGNRAGYNGIHISNEDYDSVFRGGGKCLAFFPNEELIESARCYISFGESSGYDKRYKCSVRNPWYILPSMKKTRLFLMKFSHRLAKMILSDIPMYSTHTYNRLFPLKELNHRAFIVSFYNSLTLLETEVIGNRYSGGVLSLLPREVENLFIPYNEKNDVYFEELSSSFLNCDSQESLFDFVQKNDERVLTMFTERERKEFFHEWKKQNCERLKIVLTNREK